ncbi:MAG: protein-L-isoaspartate(D-aspartate) O-methyltransferase [Alphaproteobacteria bacterium]|nr:protein-L-isoaspartate(D-aspartate) O-methyltransferase [Alphaproteobacteria bacterium]
MIATLRARLAMTARLVRERRVQDARLLWAFATVPRHRFVPAHLAAVAYTPDALQLDVDQTVTCPDFVAIMVSALRLRPGDRVLEVGTGTGYQAAILARMGARVTTVEVRPHLHAQARRHLRRCGLDVDTRCADGAEGAADAGPFDGIVVGCAASRIPQALLDQLAMGGRLVAPEGDPDRLQTLVVVTRTAHGFVREPLRAAWFVPLQRATAVGEC